MPIEAYENTNTCGAPLVENFYVGASESCKLGECDMGLECDVKMSTPVCKKPAASGENTEATQAAADEAAAIEAAAAAAAEGGNVEVNGVNSLSTENNTMAGNESQVQIDSQNGMNNPEYDAQEPANLEGNDMGEVQQQPMPGDKFTDLPSEESDSDDSVMSFLNLNLLLKSLLFACLFYIIAHPTTYQNVIVKCCGKLKGEMPNVASAILFIICYYILNLIV